MRYMMNRAGLWLGFCVWMMAVVQPARAQDGLSYRGEVTLHLTNGDTLHTDRVTVSPRFVRTDRIIGGERYDTEVIDHIEVVTRKGEQLYLLPFSVTRGLLVKRTVPTWMMRQWETYRMEFFQKEELQYQAGVTAYGSGYMTKVTTYYYRKDGGALQRMTGEQVVADVLDDPLALQLAQEASNRQRMSNGLQNGGLLVGLGVLVYSTFGGSVSEETLVGSIVGSLALYLAGSLVGLGINDRLEEALRIYEGAPR